MLPAAMPIRPADPPADQALLTIVRHGQTSANIDGIWHGSTNTPLTEHGQHQAECVGEHIALHYRPVSHVYASPLDRAHHTALAIASRLDLSPILDEDLAEFDLGAWEGLSFRTLFDDKKLFEQMQQDPHFAPHGGESPIQVAERLGGALRRLAARHPGERVVVVTHGGAMSLAFGALLENDYTRWERMMKNCAISELSLSPRAVLHSFNEIDHLPEDPQTAGG
jgi:broad specificity phosphatase PhoE